jgi:hypothetical protein
MSLITVQPILISDIVDVNKIIITNYSFNLKRDIKYWYKRNTAYYQYLKTKDPNICVNKQYNDLLYHANLLKQHKPYMSNKDICLALLMAFYTITISEHDELIEYKKILCHANNPDYVKKLYKEICGVSIVIECDDDYWSDDENIDKPILPTKNILNYENDIYKNIRTYMIFG